MAEAKKVAEWKDRGLGMHRLLLVVSQVVLPLGVIKVRGQWEVDIDRQPMIDINRNVKMFPSIDAAKKAVVSWACEIVDEWAVELLAIRDQQNEEKGG